MSSAEKVFHEGAMRAVSWSGKNKVEVCRATDPEILNPQDAIVRVTLTAICGSDLHIYGGYIPTVKERDILGHEFMGEVVVGVPHLLPYVMSNFAQAGLSEALGAELAADGTMNIVRRGEAVVSEEVFQ